MRSLVFFISLVFILFYSGCEGTTDAGDSIVFPSSGVSYSEHVQPMFSYKCTYSSCHGTETTNSRLVLTSYYEATTYPGIIVARLPNNSILIQRLDGRLQPRMPLSRDTLSKNQYNGMVTWIKEGAKNN
jgi:hypothetical protein